ncbi:MAG: histidinol dehydrogenase, partial [Steroidobacteraceae bacterium]|nr:histidinol dehydrogenase [Steroidobacteraceae bacterium]
GAAIDLPAGPSEVMIIADDSAVPAWTAADLLAQAEHDTLAQALLLATSRPFAEAVAAELDRQLPQRTRQSILRESTRTIRLLVVPDLDTAVQLANRYAPEHLLIQTCAPRSLLAEIRNAGSVFLGHLTPETLGDYCAGPNHVLPTSGHARAYSGLSLLDFQRRMTVQEASADGLRELGPTACELALLEGLDAHAQAVALRLEGLASR